MTYPVSRVVEEQLNHTLLYSVYVQTPVKQIEIPITITDLGSQALNDVAVLNATLTLATALTAALLQQLSRVAP